MMRLFVASRYIDRFIYYLWRIYCSLYCQS